MKELNRIQNPHQDDKVIDACSIFGAMDISGKRFSGASVIKAIANMHVRGNGLGGGFAVYGLYPDYADLYAFHIMYLSPRGKTDTEEFLKGHFDTVHAKGYQHVPCRLSPTRRLSGVIFLKWANTVSKICQRMTM